MKPKNTVISLPVKNIAQSLNFYKNLLGIEISSADDSIIVIELPNLPLFLIEKSDFETYSSAVNTTALQNSNTIELIISCAFQTLDEILEIKSKLSDQGLEFSEAESNNEKSYIGYFRDLDGHVWELVWNENTAKH